MYLIAMGYGDCMYVILPNTSDEQPHTINKVKISKMQGRIKGTLQLKEN